MNSTLSRTLPILVMAVLVASGSTWAASTKLDLSSLIHGDVLNSQFAASLGVTVSAVNKSTGPDLAVIFNTALTGTEDDDLQFEDYAPFTTKWNGGNLQDTPLGNVIIIQEHGVDSGGTISTEPDDEGSRPAGIIRLEFDYLVNSLEFDLVDIEPGREVDTSFVEFYRNDGLVASASYTDLKSWNPTIEFGDNYANTFAPITAAQFDGLSSLEFDRVDFLLGGSGAVTGIAFIEVPAPGALLLGSLGIVAVRWSRRHRVL